MGKVLSARDNVVPFVVPGLSVNSESSSSSTTPTPELLGPESPPAFGSRATTASSSSDSVLERGDEPSIGKLEQESREDDKKDETDLLADMPFWFEDFTDFLIPTEVPAQRSETNGIAERAVRRVKEGTSTVLLQSGLGERWWSDSTECYCFLQKVQDLLADGKTLYERRVDVLENHSEDQ